jgi:hypothetical protein
MNIDHEHAWAEFQEDLKDLKSGKKEFLTWDDVDA